MLGSEIPRGTPSLGDVQWQDNAVNEVLDHTLVTLHGLKPTPAVVDGVVLGLNTNHHHTDGGHSRGSSPGPGPQ